MARVGTGKILDAFLNGKPCKIKNDETDGTIWWYHRNRIAWKENGHFYATLAGWNTMTTRARLNALCHRLGQRSRFWQKNYVPMFDDQEASSRDVWLLTGEN